MTEIWRQGQRGWPASYPVAQFPNVPLLVAVAAWVVRRVTEAGTGVNDWATAVFYVALTAFAWWELVDGVNAFRRVIGAVVLVLAIVGVASAIGS